MSRVALIAGSGDLPAELAAELEAPLVCALADARPAGLSVDVTWHVERLVPFLRDLGARGIDTVVMAGAVNRPRLDPSLFDRETASLVPDLLAAMQKGDDAALRWVIALIEDFGLRVAGLAELAPSLLADEGLLAGPDPSGALRADAARAGQILQTMGPLDLGQGCVVARGLCLGIETLFGTDALLEDVARHRPTREPRVGGVLVKRAKPGQDLRADLPTIGPATIAAAQAAGLTGIALEARRVVILHRADTLTAASAAGISLWAEA